MSARNKKTKPQDLPVLANAEFKPIDRVDTWTGTRHDEWAEASEALQQGAVFAAGICAMDPPRVRKAVADLMAADGLEALKKLIDVWGDNIFGCKALGEMLEIARARALSGLAAYAEAPPAREAQP